MRRGSRRGGCDLVWPLPYTVVWLQGRGTLALGEGGTSLLGGLREIQQSWEATVTFLPGVLFWYLFLYRISVYFCVITFAL